MNSTPERALSHRKARSPGDTLGHTAPRRKHSSETLETGRCHPCAVIIHNTDPPPGAIKNRVSRHSGITWRWKPPRGLSKAAINSPAMIGWRWLTTNRPNLPNVQRIFLESRWEGPILPCSRQTPHVALHHVIRDLIEENVSTLPNACIVLSGEALTQTWMNDSETVIGCRRSAT